VSNNGLPFSVTRDENDISVSTDIGYNFSRQIRGGVSGTWRDQNDSIRKLKRHLRELRIWAELSF
jgi:hypothetical protein